LIPDRKTWQWFEWHPHLKNEMADMGDGTFEMVIHRNTDLLFFRQIYHTFPELETYRTNDLFVQHPDHPHLWRFHGRRDDVIVMANGEKFNPTTMETILTGDPLVRGAIIVGMARSQASLIVEPVEGHGLSTEDYIDRILPTVQKANLEGPGHGRIFPSKIIVASPSKPFIRAGKGTVIRGQNVRQFEAEIEALYDAPASSGRSAPTLSLPASKTSIQQVVQGIVSGLFHGKGALPDDVDFFNAGLDSLQTTEFAAELRAWINTNPEAAKLVTINAKTIYDHASTDRLVAYLQTALANEATSGLARPMKSRDSIMRAMIDKYTTALSARATVVLTGSTGSLGTHVLKALLRDPNTATVFCLNRSSDAEERQREALCDHGEMDLLPLLSAKARFMQADFGRTDIGLSAEELTDIRTRTDIIIHNAWAVNFNQALASFETTHIQGVRNFIDLCLSSPKAPHLAFVSSVSAVQNWGTVNGLTKAVPERIVYDPAVSLEMGYGESKYVSERILATAAEVGVKASVLRVGQIGGPLAADAGDWNKTEWFPTLLKTSKAMGIIPNTLGAIDWIPIDVLAEIFRDIVHDLRKTERATVFNLVNPHKATWEQLLPTVVERWHVAPVSFSMWVDELKKIERSGQADLHALPALKVLDFFTNMAADLGGSGNRSLEFDTGNGRRASPAMESLRAIDAKAMSTWLDQWAF
jgi:thioester reductase-like protein